MSFTLDLSRAVKNIKNESDRVVRGTIFGISSRIIKATPVGNPTLWKTNSPPKGYVGGSLRGAWQASLSAPNTTLTNRVDGSGDSAIGDVTTTIAALRSGDRFFLTNPLPYAMPVEFGWSTQAPTGMVRNAVARTQQVLNAQ